LNATIADVAGVAKGLVASRAGRAGELRLRARGGVPAVLLSGPSRGSGQLRPGRGRIPHRRGLPRGPYGPSVTEWQRDVGVAVG